MIASVVDSKTELRARVRAGRAAASRHATAGDSAARLLATARAAGLLPAPRGSGQHPPPPIAAYIAAPGEPDVGPIRSACRAAGATVLLPLPRDDRLLEWAYDDGRYEDHPKLPVQVPRGPVVGVGGSALFDHHVRVLLIPALAVDARGVRLGQGGGFYDRLLAELEQISARAIRAVAVVHDDEVLTAGSVERAPHDQLVQGALTPSRLWNFSS